MTSTEHRSQPPMFTCEADGGVAHLQLATPERRNALTMGFWSDLAAALADLATEGTRVLVVSSTGPHFSAGLDLGAFAAARIDTSTVAGRTRFVGLLRQMQAGVNALADAPFPTLAAVQGGCIGGALDLVSAACLRYVAADAFFEIAEINLGMMADLGSLNRLPHALPDAVVRELAYTGGRLGADRAVSLGFANEVCPDPIARALEVAAVIAAKNPVAVAASKQMISYSRERPVAESLAYLNALQPAIFDPDVVVASATARAGRRQPG